MKKCSPSKFEIPCSTFYGSRGFTLIEIMLVVVIILIATAIAMPIFNGTFQSTQMNDAVRSTARMARFARSMAFLKKRDCTLQFEETQMVLTSKDPTEPQTVRRFPRDINISEFENTSDETVSDENRVVHYYSNGMNDGFEHTLSDDNDRKKVISCHPISGKVTVEE
jgi:general secretion pathway protein H